MRPSLDAGRLAAALRDLPLCVVLADATGRVLFLNREAERTLGLAAEEFVGPSTDQVPGKAGGRLPVPLQEALTSGRWTGEMPLRRRTGEVFAAQVTWSVVQPTTGDAGGEVLLVGVIRDLTADRRREESRLRQARERSIGQMAGRVAHEFNNLLGAIMAAADFALSEGTPARMRRALGECLSAAERGSRVTHLMRLLAFEARPKAMAIELAHLLDHLLGALERRAENQGIQVVRDFASAPPVLAAVGLLEQAIDAILQNAVEAMPQGGRLVVGLARLHSDALVTIEDTGPGIPPELQERVFEPFFTTKAGDLGADVGMVGLGLALSRRIVEDLGGQIAVTSRPGRGTVVALVLPGAPSAGAADSVRRVRPV